MFIIILQLIVHELFYYKYISTNKFEQLLSHINVYIMNA
jgi:hypothetical protein